MTQSRRILLVLVAVAALAVNVWVQKPLDYMRYDVRAKAQGLTVSNVIDPADKGTRSLLLDLPAQFLGASAVGFREVIASVLWVRADEFFHSGQYEAILPLVRIVTWLDPQQMDVYTTGAWHMDYNFVDSEERSDRRYIPPAVKLLEEGIQNNPDVFDLYFELAWTHYFQKAKKYDKAIYWMKQAQEHPARDANTGKIVSRPPFVDRMLAHTYERAGMLDEAEKQWDKCIAQTQHFVDERDPNSYQEVLVAQKNLGLFLLRRGWRNGDMRAYQRGIDIISKMTQKDKALADALMGAKSDFARWKASGGAPHDTQPPIDAGSEINWKKVAPRVIEIYGKLNLVPADDYKDLASESVTRWYEMNSQAPANRRAKWRDGCRLRIILADYDYDYWNLPEEKTFNWELDRTQTVLWDEVSVREGNYSIKIDMSKDRATYPLAKDKYRLVVWFNPQDAPDYVQDRIGWKGEGMTDKYLNTKTNPGYRMILKEFTLSKRDIL